MTKWNHIILEGYCMYSSMKNKKQTFVDLKGNNKQTVDNPLYVDKERPKWCKKKFKGKKERIPCATCLYGSNDEKEEKCPFFCSTEVEIENQELFDLIYYVKSKRTHNINDESKEYKKEVKKLLCEIYMLGENERHNKQ